MTTVSIVSVPNDNGDRTYQAMAGDRCGDGRTPGEALDAVASQFESEPSTLVVLQNNLPDQYFTKQQLERMEALMLMWRAARESGQILSDTQKSELESLVAAELRAASDRAKTMADSLEK